MSIFDDAHALLAAAGEQLQYRDQIGVARERYDPFPLDEPEEHEA